MLPSSGCDRSLSGEGRALWGQSRAEAVRSLAVPSSPLKHTEPTKVSRAVVLGFISAQSLHSDMGSGPHHGLVSVPVIRCLEQGLACCGHAVTVY